MSSPVDGAWNWAYYYSPGDDALQTGDPLFDNILNTSPMFQLIISPYSTNGSIIYDHSEDLDTEIVLPYTSRDKYACYTEELGSRIEMISGRVVWETRGKIVKIEYAYDGMPYSLWKKLSAILRSSQAFTVYYYKDDDPVNMYQGEFICESLTPPKFAYAEPDYFETNESKRLPLPVWHGVQFKLREVEPNSGDRTR